MNKISLGGRPLRKSTELFFSKYGIYVVFVVMFIILSIVSPTFLQGENMLNILRQVSTIGMLTVGMTLVIITGGIDLSVGSMFALTGVVATMIAHPEPEYPVILVILLGAAAGGFVGLINGSIVAFSKVTPFIVTLGMMTICRGLTLTICNGRAIINLTDKFTHLGQGFILGIPIPVYFFVAIIIIGFILLHKTKFGRYVYAIGGNEMAAKVSGINIQLVKLSVYTIMGIIVGLASVLLAARTNAGSPNAGTGYELNAIAAAVIGGTRLSGGKGTIIGSIVGALILGFLGNGLDMLNVSSYIQQIVTGVIIIGSVWIDQANAK